MLKKENNSYLMVKQLKFKNLIIFILKNYGIIILGI